MADYALTRRAESDLADIAEFTTERFGTDQARGYRDGLIEAFELIARFPALGTDQGHLKPGARRLVHGSHAIYYRQRRDGVLILRILGPGQDPTRQAL